MSQRSFPIGRIFGISIDLDYSWFLIVGLLAWMLAIGYFPRKFPNWTRAEYWSTGLAAAILLFASVLLHELGHSVVAQRFGIPVPRITLFLFGGVAQIAKDAPTPKQEFWISVVGPITSLILAAFFWGIEHLVNQIGPLLALAEYLVLINVALALFNLVPGYPPRRRANIPGCPVEVDTKPLPRNHHCWPHRAVLWLFIDSLGNLGGRHGQHWGRYLDCAHWVVSAERSRKPNSRRSY